ncbi:TPA: zinc carboxypeptidase [Candidatus Gastranaerophilales bacterium HUM_18]|nr:MAG TPA: zinc carboxypeptidase [Candidatus Gastranaerophilales bacterium HUM_18]
MKIAGNLINPSVLIIGCFHEDEPQGEYLIERYLDKKPDTNIVFIPCLNKYGTKNGIRTNENGVDLNRNFPTQNWEKTEKNEFFGGEEPASEIETRFVMETVEKYKPRLILTLHAPYKIVNYDGDALVAANAISKIIGYPVEESIGYPTPGSFGTWAGVEKGIPTITLELDEEVEVQLLQEPVFKIFEMLEKY